MKYLAPLKPLVFLCHYDIFQNSAKWKCYLIMKYATNFKPPTSKQNLLMQEKLIRHVLYLQLSPTLHPGTSVAIINQDRDR